MAKWFVLGLLVMGMGCKEKKPEEVNNDMTRYVEGLQDDARRAHQVEEKANRVIHEQEEELKKATAAQ